MESHFELTDNSIMPSGLHKGKKLANVPNDYLLYLYENNKCNSALRQYIENNLDSIKPKR